MASHIAIEPLLVSTMDFENEREYFHTVIAKKLDKLCQLKSRRFFPVDLYRGLTEDQLESDDLVQISLDAVKRCSPYFICLIGEKYGLHVPPPPKVDNNDEDVEREVFLHPFMLGGGGGGLGGGGGGFSGLGSRRMSRRGSFTDFRKQHRRKSLASFAGSSPSNTTEQQNEWLKASLKKAAENGYTWLLNEAYTNSSVNDLQTTLAVFLKACKHCFVYVRSAAHQDSLYRHLSEAERERMLRQFKVESDYAAMKVEELKQRLIRKGVPMKFFTTPDELEQAILTDFEEHLGVRYVDSVDLPAISLFDAMERDQRIEQELRLEGVQIGAEFSRCLAEIDRFVADGNDAESKPAMAPVDPLEPFLRRDHSEIMAKTHLRHTGGNNQDAAPPAIFLLAGERGSGKSTLLSHWLRNFAEAQTVARADAAADGGPDGESAWLRRQPLVIPYYVGANRASCDAVNFMELVKQRVHQHFNVRSHEPQFLTLDPAFTYQEVVGSFEAALSMGRMLLVVDGLDCFGDSIGCRCDEVKRLAWLPSRLPPGCRIVASTLSSDLTCASLSRRADVKIYRFGGGGGGGGGVEMMSNFCADFGQNPDEYFWEAFAESPLAPNCPLAQSLLANEYHIVCCSQEKRTALINAIGDISSIRQLFLHLLRRWATEYGWVKLTLMEKSEQTQKSLFEKEESQIKHEWEDWVSESLALIALSRRGLSLHGILALLSRLGYSSQAQVALFDWHRFFNSAAGILQLVDGRYKFIHLHFAEIVEHIFFSCVAPAAVETRCQPSRVPTASGMRYKFHSLLGHHFLEEADHAEAIYHFDRASRFDQVMKIISDPSVFLDVFGSRDSERVLPEAELLDLWQSVEASGLDPLSYFAPHVRGKLACTLRGYEDLPAASEDAPDAANADQTTAQDSDSNDGDCLIFTATVAGAVNSKADSLERNRSTIREDQADSDIPMIMVKSATESEAGSSSRSDRLGLSESDINIMDDLRSVMSDKSTQSIDEAGTESSILFGMRLAKLLTMLKKNEHAVAILKACLALQQSVMSSSAAGLEQVSQLLIRIGRLHAAMGDEQASWEYYARAEENLRLALALCDSEQTQDSELEAETVGAKDRNRENSSQELQAKIGGPGSLTERVATNYGRLLVRFGELAFRRGRVDEARRYFERVRFCRRSSGSVTLRAAGAHKFGQLSKATGNYDQAARLLDKAYKLYHRWYGLNHLLVADTLLELGQVLADPTYPNVYNQFRAEACFRCCAFIRERCLGSRHRLVAEPLTSLGTALLQTGDGLTRSETEDVLMRALDIVSQGGNNGDSAESLLIRNLLRFCRTCWSSGTPTNTRPIAQVLASCRRIKNGIESTLPTPPSSSRRMPKRQQSARSLPTPMQLVVKSVSSLDLEDRPASALLGRQVAQQRQQLGGTVDRDVTTGSSAERKYYRALYIIKTGDSIPGLGRAGADHRQLPGCRVATPVADLSRVLRVEGAAKRLNLLLTALPPAESVSTASASGHKAAWWHCPGRYSTSERPYPPRRSQLVRRVQVRQPPV